ncbi:DUF488 family protein [Citricoccus nitrophenolicus]|uniref:DUF488 domain-containing protein n=1 Tax=Citricoccus nitrophenolicus TaxID=863575 RepID=UPI0039B524BE
MALPFYTVGHSTRSLVEFMDLLQSAEIGLVVDVRRLPGSRRYPHFDQERLSASLTGAGIGYEHLAALTGRRPRNREVATEVNGFWENRSFHHYADHAMTEEFAEGLARLRAWGAERRTAVMCSEAVWWRCHRRIIADHLLARGEQVLHLMEERSTPSARLTSGAVVDPDDGQVTYPERPSDS